MKHSNEPDVDDETRPYRGKLQMSDEHMVLMVLSFPECDANCIDRFSKLEAILYL